MTSTQNKSEDPKDPPPAPPGKTEEWFARALGSLIFLVPLYYIFVWNNLPLDAQQGNRYRWWITIGVLALGAFIGIFSTRKKIKIFEVMSNFIVVIFIVFGAAIFSIYFSQHDQTILYKVFVIAYFSFLPAWLYLHFISVKGRTLWEEYVLNLYRLHMDDVGNLPDPPALSVFNVRRRQEQRNQTVDAADPAEKSLYEKKFEGLFGPVRPDKVTPIAVFRGENLWPVAIATLLISIGWVLVTQPEPILGKEVLPSFDLNGKPVIPVETFRFAFLGAYFYVLQMLVRRYFQNDLKTSAYLSSTMRIIISMLLVWAIENVWHDESQQAQRSLLAFIIGVFPHVGWQAIQAVIKLPMKLVVPSLDQKFPLNELDGLNIWYESRLLEEGVEDLQNLATANLVDVMLNTRIPVERLVDWVDQSLLFLHLGDGSSEIAKKNREKLRTYGIRTATDLEDAFRSTDQEHLKKLERLLNTDDKEPSILRTILSAFEDEPNLRHVRHWRAFPEEIAM